MHTRALIGTLTCLAGTFLPASQSEAGGLSRLLHHRGKQQAVCSYYGYYYDSCGRLGYGLLTRMSDGSVVVSQPAPLAAEAPSPISEVDVLRAEVARLQANLNVFAGVANNASVTAGRANTTAGEANTTAGRADTTAGEANTTAGRANTTASDLKVQLDRKVKELQEAIDQKADKPK